MADVFLSYAREDQDRIADLVDALEGRGWSVWWDRQLRPGARYEDVIEKELGSARCVVVALTEAALTSAYVRSEAAEARDRGILLPALLDDVRVPLSMNQTQCADLRDWPKDDRGLVSLLTSVADLTDERAIRIRWVSAIDVRLLHVSDELGCLGVGVSFLVPSSGGRSKGVADP
jgi:hypothetical protein